MKYSHIWKPIVPQLKQEKMRNSIISVLSISIVVFSTLFISCNRTRTYQTFDEFSMSGIGEPVKKPYVSVYESDSKIVVRRSDRMNSPIIYTKKGDVWYNEQSFNQWKDNSFYTISLSEKDLPNTYYRFIHNDSIIEYNEISGDGPVLRSLIIRTRDNITAINIDGLYPDFNVDHDNMLNDLNQIISTYKKKADKIISTFKNDPVARLDEFYFYDTYTREFRNDSLFFIPSPHSYGKTIKYKLSSLGEYGTLPGLKFNYGLEIEN